jgi:glyoxylase-like metal-dependent hydrolase (beta-lactamase superfamily II)
MTRQFARAADPAPASGGGAAAMFSGKIETIRLADDLYALTGAGGNVAVAFDADRVLVIDSGIPTRGPDLLAAATKLAPAAKAKTLFNTHWHFDHTGGNDAFVKAGFTVVGSGACRERLGQTITLEDLGMTAEPIPEANRPAVTFDQALNLYAPFPVKLTKAAPAHTDTDAIAFFEKHNVLHTGDLLFAGAFPVIDRSSGGSLDGMIAASKHLLTVGDDQTRVIPGHGPVGDKAAIRAQLDLLTLAHDRLAPFGAKHASMDEVLAAKPFADLDDKWGRGFLRSEMFTRMAYGQWLQKH